MPYLLTFPSGRSLLLLRGRGLLRLGGGVHDNRRGGNRGRELGLSRVIRPGWMKHTRENVTNVSDFVEMSVHGFISNQYYCDISQFRFTHPKHHIKEKNCGWQSETHFKSVLGCLSWNPHKLTVQNTELSVIHSQVNVHTHTHTPLLWQTQSVTAKFIFELHTLRKQPLLSFTYTLVVCTIESF